jgi:hypothetical protein
MQFQYKYITHVITHNEFSACYTRCFFQYCFLYRDNGVGINSPVLKENVSEMELETLDEETDLSLKTQRVTQIFEIYCLS